MSSSPSLCPKKKQWWLSSRKIVEKYVKDARALISTEEPCDVQVALGLLDAALAARSLLYLRRFREVADMLQDYIPSFRGAEDVGDSFTSLSSDNSSSSSQSQQLSRERVKLLPSPSSSSDEEYSKPDGVLRCLSMADMKRKVLAGLYRDCGHEGAWRYMVLGKACSHLGMMEDAMVLLQTGRRLATAASRRESRYLSDDDFSSSSILISNESCPATSSSSPPILSTELEGAAHLLSHIKLLLRRRAAAVAALDAGLSTESVRHFTKLLDGRRGTPHSFAAGCLVGRAAAYRDSGRIADSIADCNRALALDPASIPALRARADLLESVRSFPDCLRDLDHLKLLYDAILRDRKLPGPAWRLHNGVRYHDIAGDLRALASRTQELRQRVARGKPTTRSELERAHLLLSLKHRPDKAAAFVDRVEFTDDYRDLDAVRDQAKMSALMLYRLLQKGYSSIMSTVIDEEAAEKQRLRAVAALQAAAATAVLSPQSTEKPAAEGESSGSQRSNVESGEPDETGRQLPSDAKAAAAAAASVFQGVFCRDLAAVGSLLSQVNFNRAISVKYEALSC
ncbi:unnamed protein product [Spirodela intermedia]|uniref:Uncharacterized protein n=1 Tax=Spirodela intermedia TaxID=51605 RepID=A0A7I8IBG6_SPIIN|nr:unnamed protein product [Spirodela intermedia]CAA6654382.1 unnamed protein product [Spirodela intermedia]